MIFNFTHQLLCVLIFVLTSVQLSDSGALNIFEQKKYKRYSDTKGLYSFKDDVEILTIENFKNEIYGNERAWLVEFYNSWCGFCQRFAPSWKALATDIRDWKDLVGIGAVDCSADENNPLCREFEIMSYPTLKYFHEHYPEGQLGNTTRAGEDVNQHRNKLLEVIMKEQAEGRGKIYPNMLPYTYSSSLKIFESAADKTEYAFLVIQDPSEYVGQALAMDLHKMNLIVRYAYNNNTELLHSLKIAKSPALFVISRDNVVQNLNSKDATREAYQLAIQRFLRPKHIYVPDSVNNKEIYRGKWKDYKVPDMAEFMQEREREALKERVKQMGDVIFQMDLETTLRYSLKHEVANTKEISGEKLEALKNYFNILAKYFPFGKYGQLFLGELRDFVSSKTSVKGDDIGDIVKGAERSERQVFSTPQHWLACKGSSPNFRGYPCGLWKMFHYLTVNAADYSTVRAESNPKVALEAMHGYIKHFFGCADCSKHFQDMAKRRDIFGVSSWDDSILWLWSAHNEVNKRLSGDQTEDPEYPKYQFPSVKRCPRCHNADSWNIPEVLHYVRHMYSNINVRYIGSDTRILHLGLDGSLHSKSESSIFKTIDTGMCFILYVASFLLIITLIHMFLKRGYRKKIYAHDILGKV